MSGERQGAACPDHGATARNDGVCMVRGCRYGTARLVDTYPDCGCHPDDCPDREGVERQGAERDALELPYDCPRCGTRHRLACCHASRHNLCDGCVEDHHSRRSARLTRPIPPGSDEVAR